ncbi:MAG: MBL fold metallo-hydrolase [Candidatus Hodarchaeota archaeon]
MASTINSWHNIRLIHSGEQDAGLHLVDLNLYDSSLFANVCIFQAEDHLVIFDGGTSNTTKQIINYMKFFDINADNILIVPSHHHFDHSGGLYPLLDHFKKICKDASILTTEKMSPLLQDLETIVKPAERQFSKMIGEVKNISRYDIRELKPFAKYRLDDDYKLKLVETPGHCDDHVSPIIYRNDEPYLCFFGEALGINLRKHLSPLPPSTAPSFRSSNYLNSVEKIKSLDAEIGIFSHVGGIRGREIIKALCDTTIEKYTEVREFIKNTYDANPVSTSELVAMMRDKYNEYIATCVMDKEIVNNLSFLLVYGMLKDLHLK